MDSYYLKEVQYYTRKEVELHGAFKAGEHLVLIGEFQYYELKQNHLICDRGDGTESYKGLTIRLVNDADCFHIIHKGLCKLYIVDVLESFFDSPDGILYARKVAAKDRFDKGVRR